MRTKNAVFTVRKMDPHNCVEIVGARTNRGMVEIDGNIVSTKIVECMLCDKKVPHHSREKMRKHLKTAHGAFSVDMENGVFLAAFAPGRRTR